MGKGAKGMPQGQGVPATGMRAKGAYRRIASISEGRKEEKDNRTANVVFQLPTNSSISSASAIKAPSGPVLGGKEPQQAQHSLQSSTLHLDSCE